MNKIPTYDKTKYVKVVCRLCGSEWLYPKQYEKEFDAEHPLENCAYCRVKKRIFFNYCHAIRIKGEKI